MRDQEPWVSVEELVLHLGVAKDVMHSWIEAKGRSAHKVGRLWTYKLSHVDAWVADGGGAARYDGGEL